MIIKHDSFGSMDNNAFLIVDEETNKSALVDCPEYNDRMQNLIGDTDLQYILLTHGHYDHIMGARDTKAKYGARVVISEADAPMLSSGKLSLAAFVGTSHISVESDAFVGEGDKIALGSLTISVMSTPGHTKGGLCYMVEDALFTGDTVFRTSCGRTDFPSGSPMEMAESLKRIKSLEGDYKIYTGHNELSTLDFERKYNPYMKQL